MIARLRPVFPPRGIAAGFILVFTSLEGPLLYWEWVIRPNRLQLDMRPGVAVVRLAAVLYAVYRVFLFHPFYRPAYEGWLVHTPWTCRKPLPLGPVAIVMEDAVTMGALLGLAWIFPEYHPSSTVTLALAIYAAMLAPTFWGTGVWAFGYVTAFGLGLVVRLWHDPGAALSAAICVAILSQAGLARSLARFPWPRTWMDERLFSWRTANRAPPEVEPGPFTKYGWPMDQLRPDGGMLLRVDRRDAVLLALLAGWWVDAIESCVPLPDRVHVSLFFGLILPALAAFGRVGKYGIAGYRSPLSIMGRLRTFRWIIPAYDRVFVAPACTVLSSFVLLFWTRSWADPTLYGPIAVAIAFLIALAGGPSAESWKLTAKVRLQCAPLDQGELKRIG